MCVLPACISVYSVHTICSGGSEENISSRGTEIIDGCELPPWRCWEPHLILWKRNQCTSQPSPVLLDFEFTKWSTIKSTHIFMKLKSVVCFLLIICSVQLITIRSQMEYHVLAGCLTAVISSNSPTQPSAKSFWFFQVLALEMKTLNIGFKKITFATWDC